MPVVPFQRMRPAQDNRLFDEQYMHDTRQQDRPPESIEKPSEMALMLAAAQMDQMGRFDAYRDIYEPQTEGEHNKWNDLLAQKGAIRLRPKDGENPQEWLGRKHIKDYLEEQGIDREDDKDGSVILRLRKLKDLTS